MVESFEEIRRNAEVTINAGKINLKDDAYDNSFVNDAHFVYELLQNADDAQADEVTFHLFTDKLVFTHNGKRKFDLKDIDSITSINQSTKNSDNDTIGKFGIGFKSVFKYTNKPEIQSGDFAFNITHIILPTIIPKKANLGDKTEITIPFNRGNSQDSYREINDKLSSISEDAIIFIDRISKVNIKSDEIDFSVSKSVTDEKKISDNFYSSKISISSSNIKDDYYCFTLKGITLFDKDNKEILNQSVKIAYLLDDDGSIIKDDYNCFYVYFPTSVKTDLPYLVHAPFQTLEGRSQIQTGTKNNEILYKSIGDAVFKSIIELKNNNKLSSDFYDAFINIEVGKQSEDITNYVIQSLTESLKDGAELLPVNPNGYSSLDKILVYKYNRQNTGELNIFEKTFTPIEIGRYIPEYLNRKFWSNGYSSKMREFLSKIDKNCVIDFNKMLDNFSAEWLEAKSIKNIIDIYKIISPPDVSNKCSDLNYPSNLPYTYSKKIALRSYPLIRNTQNHQISADSENVYLNNNSINQILLEDSYCHSFISEILIVKEYSKKDKSIDDVKFILSKYDDNESAKKITASENIDDLKKLRDYIDDRQIQIDEESVNNHKIIYADRCDKTESCWHTPEDIYLTVNMGGDEFTEKLLSGINSVYFLSEGYYEKYNNDDFITLIKKYITPNLEPIPHKGKYSYKAGYTDKIFKNGSEATSNIKNQLHVYSSRTIYIKPTENTSPDFNPYLEIPHLNEILDNITFEKSIILFRYLSRYVSRIYDEVKYNSAKSFAENSEIKDKQKIYSEMGYLLYNRSWLYDNDNNIRPPYSVYDSELNEKYSEISKELLLKLGVHGIISEEFKEIIYNLSPEDEKKAKIIESLAGYSDEELMEMKCDFINKKITENKKLINKNSLNPTKAFSSHDIIGSGNAKDYDSDKIYSSVKNTQKYSENIGKEIDKHSTNEPRTKIKTQSIIVDDNKTEKEFLKSEYSGKCQICGKEIIKRDETPFFVVHKLDKNLNPVYINSRDVGWDSICICPNCDAELKNCPNNISSAILNAFKNSTNNNFESGMKISFDFWGEKREIKLTQRHILRIIAAFKSFDEKDKDE